MSKLAITAGGMAAMKNMRERHAMAKTHFSLRPQSHVLPLMVRPLWDVQALLEPAHKVVSMRGILGFNKLCALVPPAIH